MTQEEKAERYDKSFERAKEQLNGAKVFDYDNEQIAHDIRTTVYNIFPELKESEDEMIRKDVKRAISIALDYSYFDKETANNCLSWLEKQGEDKPVISDDALREGIAHFGITQYQIDNWLKKYVDVEKQGEQKPAWSEEDEKRVESLHGWLDTLVNYIHHDAIVSLDLRRERMQQVERLKTWLKSLKERYTWKPSDEQMERLKGIINSLPHQEVLYSLYQDLKKLKG